MRLSREQTPKNGTTMVNTPYLPCSLQTRRTTLMAVLEVPVTVVMEKTTVLAALLR